MPIRRLAPESLHVRALASLLEQYGDEMKPKLGSLLEDIAYNMWVELPLEVRPPRAPKLRKYSSILP
jgi:hypothetical protein